MDAPPNPFASIDMTRGEEEEDILSALSPASYLRRLHREMDGDGERYRRYEVAAASSVNPPVFGALRGNDSSNVDGSGRCVRAGTSAETALEIDDSDSDDDVVEVVAVEATM